VSSSAAAGFQGQVDVRQVGKDLDARFVLVGSIRKAGSSIRVSIQLVDASTGDQLWAERLDRDLGTSDIFDTQDELTDRIVATVADSSGVLTRSLAALVKAKQVDTLTADECVLLTFAYWEQVRPDLHAEVRTALERAVKQEPRHAEAWACLSRVYLDEDRFGLNVQPNVLDRALEAAREAVELDATSQNAYRSLAEAHYYRREFSAFRPAAERVLTLNPRDTSNIGMTSQLIAYGTGDWARGRAISEKAVKMNPHHAGWLNFMFVHDHYLKGEYEQALEFGEKINMPGYNWASGVLAAIHGQLGNSEAARIHVRTFVALAPEYARNFRSEGLKWMSSEDLIDRIGEGLQKAGLDDELRRLDAAAS